MKTQLSRMVKMNGMIVASLFCTGAIAADTPRLPSPVYTIAPYERPLSIYAFPNQDGTANSPFAFNLVTYISKLKPEIDYLISNRANGALGWFAIKKLPVGVTQLTEGESVCQDKFELNSGQSCVLRLLVDKTKFTSILLPTPTACFTSGPPYFFPISQACLDPEYQQRLGAIIDTLPDTTVVTAEPQSQDGLRFDPAKLTIAGTPTRSGLYTFTIGAGNNKATAAKRILNILVQTNVKDKPVFKTNPSIASAMPNQAWQLDLMSLLEPRPGFMVSNQVSFRIEKNLPHPDWLSIDEKNPTILKGRASSNQAGQVESVTLIATSNTGGESLPMTINIPVAYDPAKKPLIDTNISLTGTAGSEFHHDFRANISDPAQDGNLQILLDKIEPSTLVLNVSPYNPTELYGVAGKNDAGKEYKITLRAKTTIGGMSDAVSIPLNIAINKNKTPRFYAASPKLPLLYAGQSYEYDFVANNDVHPEYSDIPYVVELAKDANNPPWIRMENNKLIIDKVPNNLPQTQEVFITIKNVPGGQSEVYPLSLDVME